MQVSIYSTQLVKRNEFTLLAAGVIEGIQGKTVWSENRPATQGIDSFY